MYGGKVNFVTPRIREEKNVEFISQTQRKIAVPPCYIWGRYQTDAETASACSYSYYSLVVELGTIVIIVFAHQEKKIESINKKIKVLAPWDPAEAVT